ncbi:zf-HC2 domain-containing protein [bacterium]|nr:zf-HC2 domain-containing protein [bacterium]
MKCTDITPLLGPFLDGELDKKQRPAVAEHLEACPACRRELERLAAVDSAAASGYVPDPGREYWKQSRKNISDRIDGTGVTYGEQKEPWYRALIPAPALGFAGVAVTAVLVFFVVKYTGQRDTLSSGSERIMRFEAPAPEREIAAETALLDESKSVTGQTAGALEERLDAAPAERIAPPPPAAAREEADADKAVLPIAGVGRSKTDAIKGTDEVGEVKPLPATGAGGKDTPTRVLKAKTAARDTTITVVGGQEYPDTKAGRRLTSVRSSQNAFEHGDNVQIINANVTASRLKEADTTGMSPEFQHICLQVLDTDDLQVKFRLWEHFIRTGPSRLEENRARFKQAAIYTNIAWQDTSSSMTIEKAIAFLDSVLPSFTDPGQQVNIVRYRDSLQRLLEQKPQR